jgi:tetratricopeptide (TPR) repeat protein
LCQAAFQQFQDRFDEADRMWRAIASAAALAGDIPALADARLRIAAATVERGYAAEAMGLLDECVATFEQRDDSTNLAYALYWRAASAWDQELFSAARRDAERGVARLSALALGVRGDAYQGLGRYEDEVAALLQALAIFRSHSIRRHQAICQLKLGSAYQALGKHQLATRHLEESLPVFRQLGLRSYEQRAIQTLHDCLRLSVT